MIDKSFFYKKFIYVCVLRMGRVVVQKENTLVLSNINGTRCVLWLVVAVMVNIVYICVLLITSAPGCVLWMIETDDQLLCASGCLKGKNCDGDVLFLCRANSVCLCVCFVSCGCDGDRPFLCVLCLLCSFDSVSLCVLWIVLGMKTDYSRESCVLSTPCVSVCFSEWWLWWRQKYSCPVNCTCLWVCIMIYSFCRD